MAVFSAMYHTLFYPSYLQDIRQQHAWKVAKTGYTLCLNLSTFRIHLELRGVRSLLKCSWLSVSFAVCRESEYATRLTYISAPKRRKRLLYAN